MCRFWNGTDLRFKCIQDAEWIQIICTVRSDPRDSDAQAHHPDRCRASASCADYQAGYGRSRPHRHRRGSRRTLGGVVVVVVVGAAVVVVVGGRVVVVVVGGNVVVVGGGVVVVVVGGAVVVVLVVMLVVVVVVATTPRIRTTLRPSMAA